VGWKKSPEMVTNRLQRGLQGEENLNYYYVMNGQHGTVRRVGMLNNGEAAEAG